jgi:hypothetical protein
MNSGKKIGDLSVSQLVKVLEPHFLAVSLGTAPNAQGTAGGRTTALTTATVQVKLASLVSGIYVWRFDTPYVNPPIVVAMPVGAGITDSRLFLAEEVTKFAAKIKSHDASDVRIIHLLAVGNPN